MIFNARAGNCLPITIRTGSPAGFRSTSVSHEPGGRAGRAIIQPAPINGCVTWAVSAPPVLPHSHPCGHRYGDGQKLLHTNQPLSVPRDTTIIGKIFPIVKPRRGAFIREGGETVNADAKARGTECANGPETEGTLARTTEVTLKLDVETYVQAVLTAIHDNPEE